MTTVPQESGIQLSDVSVVRGGRRVLSGVDLTVAGGRVCALLGENGAGKSTLLQATLGTVPLQSGAVRLAGRPGPQARRAGCVAYVPQEHDADRRFPATAWDVVAMGRFGKVGLLGRLGPADRAAISGALDQLGVGALASRAIGELSGGQRRRVFLARALAQEPSVLLADEPFAGADAASVGAITQALRSAAADGASVLLATHDLAGLESVADEAVLLRALGPGSDDAGATSVAARGSVAEVTRADVLAQLFAGAP